jgi:hypothetical protein
MRAVRHSSFPIILGSLSAATLNSCNATRPGPKLVEADVAAYTACGGALWFEDMREPKDNEPRTYEVIYKGAHGTKHQLTKVRTLKITDLPDNTPACPNPQ